MLLDGTNQTPSSRFLDARSRRLVRWKLASVAVQSFFITLALCYYQMGDVLVKVVLLLGTDVMMLVYTTMHFAAILVALQLLSDCNGQLCECVAAVRALGAQLPSTNASYMCTQRRMREATARIERLALLYVRIAEWAVRSNAIFAVPVVLTLMNSFLYILVAVSGYGQ